MTTETGEDKSIWCARLLTSRPEEVYRGLKDYGDQHKRDWAECNQALETALLQRDDPLVDLGLAQYATTTEVVSVIFKKGLATPTPMRDALYLKGLRIACLSNQVLMNKLLSSFDPIEIIGEAEFQRVIAEEVEDEAHALICNPNLDTSLLGSLYQHSGLFADIPELRWLRLIVMSRDNPRLNLGDSDLHKAIYGLLETAPTTTPLPWPEVLYELLYRLVPAHFTPEQIDQVLTRWSTVENGDVADDRFRQKLCCLIAALYGGQLIAAKENKQRGLWPWRDANGGVQSMACAHGSDVGAMAVRSAYYARATLTPRDFEYATIHDSDVYQLAVLLNEGVYRDTSMRRLLEEWGWFDRDRYFAQCVQIHRREPHFDPRPLSPKLAFEFELWRGKQPFDQPRFRPDNVSTEIPR